MSEEVLAISKERAAEVLTEIDNIVSQTEEFANRSVAKVSKLLVEAKHNAYWIERGFKTEDEYIKTLPYSRAQYYNLLGIGLHLGFLPEETIAEIGVKKAEALVRISKHSPSLTDEWLEKAKNETHEEFLQDVRSFFKAKDSQSDETFEWIRIKAAKDQSNVIREALEIASNMLGSEKSQAHQLEAICADFLSHYNDDGSGRLENRNGFMLSIIRNLAKNLDEAALEALVGTLASVVEEKDAE